MTSVNSTGSFPKEAHYAAIVFKSVWVEGDERSHTHPGHGYPGHHQPAIEYIAFASEAEMLDWAKKQETKVSGKTPYHIVRATPTVLEVQLQVKVRKTS